MGGGSGVLKQVQLGQTGLEVTELCFGVLPCGPLQKDLPEEECVSLIRAALAAGINFFDTAESYKTQSYLGKALKGWAKPVVVATKSAATSYEGMQASVEKSLAELDREIIDIYHLHAARVDENVFTERAGALECLKDYKAKGKIRAVGISTHNVKAVRVAAARDDIDVIFPLINKVGRGLLGGTVEEMIAAIGEAAAAGKGVYAMKALAGGHLLGDLADAFTFVREIPGNQATAVGMVSREELAYNVAFFAGREIPENLAGTTEIKQKRILISSFCAGCGTCVKTCPNGALSLQDGKAVVDHSLCILCGYCNPVCPEFAIRLI